MAKAMSYKKFRESEKDFYVSSLGRLNREEVIRKMEQFIVEKRGSGQDFLDEYGIREE